MRILVTGSSGFIGKHVVQRLSDMGGHAVVAYDILVRDGQALPGVEFVQGDVLDRGDLLERSRDVDCIIHAAALVPLTKSGRRFREVNVGGTRNVIACCRQNRSKLVYISSSAIYGLPDDVPITDASAYHPIEIYGRSKLEAEQAIWEFMAQGGRASCIRPRTTIGGTARLGIFHILFEWLSEGRSIYIIGSGSQLFQFVHIDDLVDAIVRSALLEHGGLYNIGTDRYGTLREDLEALLAHAGTGSRIRCIPFGIAGPVLYLADIARLSPLAPWHYLTYHKPFVFDISRAKDELGWHPKYSNQEALIASYDWYLAHRHDQGGQVLSVHTRPLRQGLLRLIKHLS